MGRIAIAIKHMLACGASSDAVVSAIAEMEGSAMSGAERTKRWRDATSPTSRASRSSPASQPPHTPLRDNNKKITPKPPLNAFDEFYAAYPRKEARRGALKAYTNALTRGTEAEILAGVKRYAAARAGQDAKFTKTPAAWLNSDCWLDQPATNSGHVPLGPKRTWAEIKAERDAKTN